MGKEEHINLKTVAGWGSLIVTLGLLTLWLGIVVLLFPIWLMVIGWKWFYY